MAFRKFKVNWKLKAATFVALDRAPFGEQIYYLLQRYVTHTIPRALTPTCKSGATQIAHAKRFQARGIDLSTANLFEFGAGWDLYSNIILYCLGVNHQLTVDVRRWARAEAINAVIRQLQTDPPEGAVRLPRQTIKQSRLEEDLLSAYGITYRAPADTAALDVESGSFELIVTTSVLEHIPESVLPGIMRECNRILKQGGIMSHTIDYSDHYAHADPSINKYNYLQFSEKEWEAYNPGIHFQNRCRARFFFKVFEASGFAVVEAVPWKGESDELSKVTINKEFGQYSTEDLLELGGHFLLKKSESHRAAN